MYVCIESVYAIYICVHLRLSLCLYLFARPNGTHIHLSISAIKKRQPPILLFLNRRENSPNTDGEKEDDDVEAAEEDDEDGESTGNRRRRRRKKKKTKKKTKKVTLQHVRGLFQSTIKRFISCQPL